jgi:hypothetical protein
MIPTPLSPSEEADVARELQQPLAAYQRIFPAANVRVIPSSVEHGISMARWRRDDLTKQFEQYYQTQAQMQVPPRHPAPPIGEEPPNTPGDLFEGAPAYVPQYSRAQKRGQKGQR